MDCKKEKNLIVIKHPSLPKTYAIDINTASVIGVGGRVVKQIPEYLKQDRKDENNLLHLLVNAFLEAESNYRYRGVERDTLIAYMQFCDRLVALGLKPVDETDFLRNQRAFESLKLTAETVAFFKTRCNSSVDLNEYKNKSLYEKLERYHIPANIVRYVRTIAEEVNDDKDYMEYCLSKLGFNYFHMVDNIYNMLIDYYKLCAKMGIAWEKSKSFLETYARTKQEYEAFRQKQIAVNLVKYNTQNYAFEDENFIVIVPTTPEQFKDEADQQSNCVYRMYMQHVADGNTNITFIRRKSEITKSYVTCEVKDYEIRQSLTAHNNRPSDIQVREFIGKYQKYLHSIKPKAVSTRR